MCTFWWVFTCRWSFRCRSHREGSCATSYMYIATKHRLYHFLWNVRCCFMITSIMSDSTIFEWYIYNIFIFLIEWKRLFIHAYTCTSIVSSMDHVIKTPRLIKPRKRLYNSGLEISRVRATSNFAPMEPEKGPCPWVNYITRGKLLSLKLPLVIKPPQE